MPLFTTARIRLLPASGAIVNVLRPLAARESTSSWVTESALKEATDMLRPSPRISRHRLSISG